MQCVEEQRSLGRRVVSSDDPYGGYPRVEDNLYAIWL